MNTNRIINLLSNPQYEAIYQALLKYFDADVLNSFINNLDDNKIFKEFNKEFNLRENEDIIYKDYKKIIIGCNKDKTVFYTANIYKFNNIITVKPETITIVDYAELIAKIISQVKNNAVDSTKNDEISMEKMKTIIDKYLSKELNE